MILVYIIMFILLCYGINIFKINEYNQNPLSLKSSNALKGVAAIVVVLHHISQKVDNPASLILFRFVGYLSVAIFFFYSGYGLMVSYSSKENYLEGFWKNRMPKIIIPFVVSNIIYIIVYLIGGQKYSIYDIFAYGVGIKLINSNMWYIVTTIILYCGFYILFKYCKKNKAIIGMGGLITCYCLICILIGKGSWWYNSTYCFFIGILFGVYHKSIFSFIRKRYAVIGMSTSIVFAITFILNVLISQIFGLIASIFFVLTIITLLIKIEIGNKVIGFLGNISYEIYLVHGIILNKFLVLDNKYLYLVVCVGVTILTAYIFNIFLRKIISIYTSLVNKKVQAVVVK